jgi:glyoxylase-like metal-dependent hydrolase (beta-lactamase superfamily II)
LVLSSEGAGRNGEVWTALGASVIVLSMPLEDHIGDICRKARIQTNTSIVAATAAAGVDEPSLYAFETDGVEASVNIEALAGLLGLDVAKTGRIAAGWEPASVDLSLWQELRMVTTAEGFEVNSFLVWDAQSRAAALFDTGWFADDIFKLIDDHDLDLQHLFITHMHGDHVAAMPTVRNRYPGVRLHSNSEHAPKEQRVTPSESISVGVLCVRARLTPGHAPDGVTYVIKGWPNDAPMAAVVGDAVFAGSMGKGFNTPQLAQQKIREEILTLPLDTLVCPGHGPLTTIAEERENNPFFP